MDEEDYEDLDPLDLEDDSSCDYGVCEPCCDPWTKEMGLCTTECAAYLKAVEEDAAHKER